MAKLLVLGSVLWLLIFLFRINQVGGLDTTYQEPPTLLLKPVQEKLSTVAQQIMPYPESGLLAGMLVGSSENIPYFLRNDLKSTSTIHLIVVSGQNLSIIAGFSMSLVSLLGRRKTIFLTLAVIIFYSVLTGLQVPVLRSALMASMTYLAQIIGREVVGWWVLLLTAGIMLLFNPNYLFSISFQLSFIATLGVVVVAPVITTRLKWIPKILREDFGVSLAAQLLTLPLIALYFQRISIIGILSNSLILWSIPILMISGFIALGAGLINILFGQIIGLLPSILLSYFVTIVSLFAKFPLASISLGETSWVLWLGYYLVVGAAVWGMGMKDKSS